MRYVITAAVSLAAFALAGHAASALPLPTMPQGAEGVVDPVQYRRITRGSINSAPRPPSGDSSLSLNLGGASSITSPSAIPSPGATLFGPPAPPAPYYYSGYYFSSPPGYYYSSPNTSWYSSEPTASWWSSGRRYRKANRRRTYIDK